jgi:hypothetical protein
LETEDAVDDLRVDFGSGWTAFIQVKRTLRGGDVLAKAVAQWVRASTELPDHDLYRLVIAAGELSNSMKALSRALDARRLSISGTPTRPEAAQLQRVEHLLSPLDTSTRERVLQSAVVWHLDVEEAHHVGAQLALHQLRGLVVGGGVSEASKAWAALLDAAGHAARRRGGHDLHGWRVALLDRGVDIAEPGSSLGNPDNTALRDADQQACGLPERVWVAGRQAVPSVRSGTLGRRRVLDTDPFLLGVRESIEVRGATLGSLPVYVRRDVEDGEFGIRARLRAMAASGGFLLIVGESSVGKTRTAYEAVCAELGDWELVQPADTAQIDALTERPPDRPVVVWLDEVKIYVDAAHGLTGETVRNLLGTSTPVILIATIWPDDLDLYTRIPAGRGSDPYRHAREVFRLAKRFSLGAGFTTDETARARAAADAGDDRIAACLGLDGVYSLPQHLAAVPALLHHLASAPPYAKAVLLAALDAHRLGARAALAPALLEAAAVDYCTPREQAGAPDGWFEQAIAYNTRCLHGSASALTPVGAGMGVQTGFVAADYLRQHAVRARRADRPPASLWTALRDHLADLGDIERVASAASARHIYVITVPLLLTLMEDGSFEAAGRLAWLLADAGDLEGLTELANAGWSDGAEQLAVFLAKAGDRGTLRVRAAAGDWDAAHRLADLLYQDRDQDGLGAMVEAGHHMLAACRLATLLAEEGNLRGAIEVLEGSIEAGEWMDIRMLNRLLAEVGDRERLRVRSDQGDRDAADQLAGLFVEAGDRDGLRARADAGDRPAAIRLADLQAEAGDHVGAVAALRVLAEDGDRPAARRLADLLAEAGDRQGLRELADGGYRGASHRAAELLGKLGDFDALRVRADAGDGSAAYELNQLLAKAGEHVALRERFDAGDEWAARPLADLLANIGDATGALEILQSLADTGDDEAAERLATLLVEAGDREALEARADAGDGESADRLATLLAEAGDHKALRARTDAGDLWAAHHLARLQSDAGDDLLLRFGFNPDGSVADHRGWEKYQVPLCELAVLLSQKMITF